MSGDAMIEFETSKEYNQFLSDENYDGFLETLKEKNIHELENEADEVISIFCTHLNLKTKQRVLDLFDDCLKYLANKCNPKNLLIICTENINKAEKLQDIIFLQFLDPIFICLDRIKFPKARALSMSLNDLYKRIYYLDLPKDLNLEDKERKLMIFDTETQTITKWIIGLQIKINPFTLQTFSQFEDIKKNNKEVKEILKFEFRLLSKPLAYLDLTSDHTSIASESRKAAEMIMVVFNHLQPDPVKLICQCFEENEKNEILKRKSPKFMNDEDVEIFGSKLYSDLGISTYAYLVFGENLKDFKIPKIYNHTFLFLLNVPFISHMLSNTESSLLTLKGLQLSLLLMRRLSQGVLQHEQLESRELHELLKCLSYVATSSKVNDFKQLSLQLIATIVKAFNFEARSKLLFLLISRFAKMGVVGMLITLLKDEILENYEKPDLADILDVEKLYQIIFALPKAEKSDLLENSEHIVGALNLLKLLVTLDPPAKNATKIWNVLPTIEDQFLHDLGRAIELSRCHFSLEMKKLKERMRLVRQVGNEQPQLYCFNKALKTFEMMNEMLSRVSSVIQFEKTKTSQDDFCVEK